MTAPTRSHCYICCAHSSSTTHIFEGKDAAHSIDPITGRRGHRNERLHAYMSALYSPIGLGKAGCFCFCRPKSRARQRTAQAVVLADFSRTRTLNTRGSRASCQQISIPCHREDLEPLRLLWAEADSNHMSGSVSSGWKPCGNWPGGVSGRRATRSIPGLVGRWRNQ